MKKNILLTLIALLSMVSAQAYNFQSGDLYYNITSSTEPFTVEVTYQKRWPEDNYKGLTAVTIPATIIYSGTTYNVTSIGSSAFSGCTGLASITVPNSVTSIGNYAFSGCTGLTSVTIPNSVASIGEGIFGEGAFSGCSGLISIIVESGNTVYDSRENCNAIIETATNALIQGCNTTIIPNSVTSIGNWAFSSCAGLTSITIPNSVTSIGDYAFYYCTGLTSITVPESVTSIGGYAFCGCTSLTSITIPNSVTSIGEDAFSGVLNIVYNGTATGSPWGARSASGYIEGYLVYEDANKTKILTCSPAATGTVTIPESVTSIGSHAFEKCTGLTSVTIPNSVTSIGSHAFEKCTGLTSVTIPNSVTSIGWSAFEGCTGLTAITIPNSVTTIENSTFAGCTSLTSVTIPNSVTTIENSAFWCTGLTSITIPNSVTSIGNGAFMGCTALTSITIPNSVTSIGLSAFEGCTGLTSITIPESVTSIESGTFSGCTGLTSVTIPSSVTTIKGRTFKNCTSLTSITIPNSVTSIGLSAFEGCTGLTAITIPNSVTTIENSTFDGCTGLTSVTIPDSVTSIGAWAFDGCTGLTSVTIPNSVTSIGWSAFAGCTGLTSITIPNSVTSIGMGAFAACIGITSIVVESGNTVYDSRENCNAIIETATNALIQGCNTTIIPNNITSIGGYAFAGCTGLTSITIPNNVTSIGNYAFWYCTGLTSVVWNAKKCGGWNRGSDSPFYSIKDTITSFTFGNEVDSIPAYLCTGMCKLTAITIPNSVTSIGEWAFYGCTGLISITIPNSVTSIGDGAFSRCTGLTSIVWNAKYCSGWSNYYDSPFYNIRNNITSFSFGNEVDSIPYAICDNMWKLRSITIPESVTHIGGSAFYGCSSLTSVTIPNRVTSMGNYAFRNCTGLISIQVEAQTPPQCFESSFYDIPKDIPVYISCGTKEAYQAADGWSAFTNIVEEHDYAATILSSNEDYGTTTIVSYTCNNELTIQAIANEHYNFTQWSDGSTDNPRTFVVVQDTALTAIFAPKQYSISVSSEYGSVQGAGKYDYGTTATLIAEADEHYHFTQWNDGNTDNPRTITIEGDATYTAEFAIDQFTITATCELQYGEVTGGGVYDYGTHITLTAIPHSGYEFKQWSNGLTDNPYHFTVLEDLTLEAVFIPSSATAIENTEIVTTPQKVLINGQIYILRNGKAYTLTGTKVE